MSFFVPSFLYDAVLKGFFKLRPEPAHHVMMSALGVVQKFPSLQSLTERLFGVNDPRLSQDVAGIHISRPLGLAAGFDKDATRVDVWESCGFGFAEVGTLTTLPQSGNPAPRLFRLPEDKALLNRMGFNNQGANAAAEFLARRDTSKVIGVNLGKSKRTEASVAASDYHHSARVLEPYADYLVINVSSPNTPGLRDLQAVSSLDPIISAVQQVSDKPLFVKIAPDLSNEDIKAVADLAVKRNISGLIATNTTISREGLKTNPETVKSLGDGGISGPPEAHRSLEVLRLLRAHIGDALVLVSVGGIETPEQAWERIVAGATLLQGFTGMIYGGPEWIRRIHQGILEQLDKHSLKNVSEAVGSDLAWIS